MRISEADAQHEFKLKGIVLQTHTLLSYHFQLHYAQVGNDSFPTLLFVHGSPGSWDAFKQYMQDSDLLQKYRMVSIDRPGFGYSQFGNARNLQEQSDIISPLLDQIQNSKNVYVVGYSLGDPPFG